MTVEEQIGKQLAAIADELAGIREALEQLDTRLMFGLVTTPSAQRLHLALGRCWCGGDHTIAEAIGLNAALDILQPEEGTDAH